MSLISLMGALEIGLIFALVALGVLISFRILNFPDLTADGSFPLGGAVAAIMIAGGQSPWLACAAAMLAGAAAGWVTAWLNVRLNILQLLASILVMIALYSINLRVMGAPNVALIGSPTVFSPLIGDASERAMWVQPGVLAAIVVAAKLLLDAYFASQSGLAMRATGANPRMARAQGISTNRAILTGMALSNALIALGGALYVQTQGGADISMGVGTIVVGLAAVIIGETLIPSRSLWVITLATVLGAILYRLFIALALSADFIGLQAQDLNLVTAVLVGLALVLPTLKAKLRKTVKGNPA
ncbi:ABC transporter permease [Rivihabitans pingtungensis]|jgi:putative ABC transport system permease protein|uniref:ABC transporter permease n=1 Tax=Rivihabitans pingtungensis TaxID=1054498 RepID=UPI002357C3BB|nr:ABC transporter permease [Rivihabitans pingtungensis]MCK6436274.1 ABC transporter permease [Rivihabitans pingtungensis]HNX72071.1 ABC transporter permease [Rivihabitans pingtungensis]